MTRTDGIRGWLIAAAVIALLAMTFYFALFIIGMVAVFRSYPLVRPTVLAFIATTLFGGVAAISFVARSVIRRVADERDDLAERVSTPPGGNDTAANPVGGIPPGD